MTKIKLNYDNFLYIINTCIRVYLSVNRRFLIESVKLIIISINVYTTTIIDLVQPVQQILEKIS